MDVSNEQILDSKVVYGVTPNGAVLEINKSKGYNGWEIGLQGGGPTPLPLRGKYSRLEPAKTAIRNYLIKLDQEAEIRQAKAETKAKPKKKSAKSKE